MGHAVEDEIIYSKFPVPPEDEAELKRQRRYFSTSLMSFSQSLRLMNVSAQLSRLKKRARMDELERMVAQLNSQNTDLQRKASCFPCVGSISFVQIQEIGLENDGIQRTTASLIAENDASAHIAI